MNQRFDTIDVLRLEVEDDPSGLVNLVQNPSGDLGGWGWVTPVAGSSLSGEVVDDVRVLVFSSPGGVASWFYTEALPVTAGQYAAASWVYDGGDGFYRVRYEWLDASQAVLSSTTQTGYLNAVDMTVPYGPHQAPASTAYVRLRVDHYSTNAGAVPTAGQVLRFREVTVAKAATSGELGTLWKNLVPNPSLAVDAKGWIGVDATVAWASASYVGTGSLMVTATTPGVDAQAQTLPGKPGIPVTGGQSYTAQGRTRAESTPRDARMRIHWYDALGQWLSTSSGSSTLNATITWRPHTLTATAPSTAVTCAVVISVSGAAVGETHWVDAVMLKQAGTGGTSYFDGDTADADGYAYDWVSQPPLVMTRTNLLANPSFETNTAGWAAGDANTTIARSSTVGGQSGAWALRLTRTGSTGITSATTPIGTSGIPVTAGLSYAVSAYFRANTFARDCKVAMYFYNAAGAFIASVSAAAVFDIAGSWHRGSVTYKAPAGAAYVAVQVRAEGALANEHHYVDAVMFEQASSVGAYFDGSTADGTVDFGTVDRAWTGTAHASTSTETTTVTLPYSTATTSNLSFIEPVPYRNVLGSTHQIAIERDELDAGTLTATIIDPTLDPSQASIVRPGRRVRVLALDPDGTWQPLFLGKLLRGTASYNLRERNPLKQTKITLVASDVATSAAGVKRGEGVGTIDDLPYVLEGCGVPWNVNGSGNQVPTATVVSLNENASALDQVAITRDSVLGYAWADRFGVIQAWDAAQIDATVAAVLDEAAYSDIQVDYDTDRCINSVTIKYLRITPGTGETEEVTYGPYVDQASVQEWEVHPADFTVHGITEDTSTLAAYATAILTANATPTVGVQSLTIPIRELADIAATKALLDLYDLVTVVNVAKGIDEDNRVRSIRHSITGRSWLVTVGFSTEGRVAPPQVTPSPSPSGGKTLAQLLRPVGELTDFICAKADIPAGWLPLDGSTFDAGTYPELYAMLGNSNVLPDFTDLGRVGAGTKALLTTGGSPTHVLAAGNLPPHAHSINHGHDIATTSSATGSAIGRVARGTATDSGNLAAPIVNHTGNSGNGPGASTPVNHLDPWVAVWPCVRAA